MIPTPPGEGELEALQQQHAHRYPRPIRATVTGDNDKPVTLQLLIGLPTGALPPLPGVVASPAWGDAIASAFKVREHSADVDDELVIDCILWPPAATFAQWLMRWPGITTPLLGVVRRHAGADLGQISKPTIKPPPLIATALGADARASWRRFSPPGEVLDLAILPASRTAWSGTIDALRARDANVPKLCRQTAESVIAVCVSTTRGPVPRGEALDRWPGLGVLALLVCSELAGVAAEIDEGN